MTTKGETMAAKSCRKIEGLIMADAILSYIGASKEPASIADIARATEFSMDSCFRQLGTKKSDDRQL